MTQQSLTILILGSSGFIGKHVSHRLAQMGHQLRLPSRRQIDFTKPNWDGAIALLQDVDVMINMVGIMSRDAKLLEQVHHHTPARLASMAKQMGVRRWVNLSALGADSQHKVAFVGSKGRGDEALLHLANVDTNVNNGNGMNEGFEVLIARPSLVYGRGGASCELFIKLAKLPILALPNAGQNKVQPVHVYDVAEGLVRLATLADNPLAGGNLEKSSLEESNLKKSNLNKNNLADKKGGMDTSQRQCCIINFTGGEACTLADYLTMMRQQIHGKGKPVIASLPIGIATQGAKLVSPLSRGLISPDSLTLLQAGSVADAYPFSQLLGRKPISYNEFGYNGFGALSSAIKGKANSPHSDNAL